MQTQKLSSNKFHHAVEVIQDLVKDGWTIETNGENYARLIGGRFYFTATKEDEPVEVVVEKKPARKSATKGDES